MAGAKAFSGVQSFLLPQSVCEAASKHTQLASKLRYSLSQISKGRPWGKGSGNAFVPISQRKCYGCGQQGHALAECPNLSDEEKVQKLKEIATANAGKAGGKRRGGAAKGKL